MKHYKRQRSTVMKHYKFRDETLEKIRFSSLEKEFSIPL
jgi:hypothetical protein